MFYRDEIIYTNSVCAMIPSTAKYMVPMLIKIIFSDLKLLF